MVIISVLILFVCTTVEAQDTTSTSYEKHGVVWSVGLFKSWLKDNYVGFNKIGDQINPVFSNQKKMGFAIQSHYMYKPVKWMGFGVHLGLGLDVNSYIEAPVVFAPSKEISNEGQGLRTFAYAKGNVYLTNVEKLPNVREII